MLSPVSAVPYCQESVIDIREFSVKDRKFVISLRGQRISTGKSSRGKSEGCLGKCVVTYLEAYLRSRAPKVVLPNGKQA